MRSMRFGGHAQSRISQRKANFVTPAVYCPFPTACTDNSWIDALIAEWSIKFEQIFVDWVVPIHRQNDYINASIVPNIAGCGLATQAVATHGSNRKENSIVGPQGWSLRQVVAQHEWSLTQVWLYYFKWGVKKKEKNIYYTFKN